MTTDQSDAPTKCPNCGGPMDPHTLTLGVPDATCVWCWTEWAYGVTRPFTPEQVTAWLARDTDTYSPEDADYVLSHNPDGTPVASAQPERSNTP